MRTKRERVPESKVWLAITPTLTLTRTHTRTRTLTLTLN